MSMKITKEELTIRVNTHPANVTLVSCEGYKNGASLITIKCNESNHIFTRKAEDFSPNGRFTKCPKCGLSLGQSIACAVTGFLLNVKVLHEFTPVYLKNWHPSRLALRHDGYIKSYNIDNENITVAIEHNGDQHTNPKNKYHQRKDMTTAESYNLLKESDNYKVDACKEYSVRLITIPDLYASANSILDAAKIVMNCIEKCIPEVHLNQEYNHRTQQINDRDFLIKLINQYGFDNSRIQRLREDLYEEGNNMISITSFDPVSNRVTLQCTAHDLPEHYTWDANLNNLLGSVDRTRKGTRCPQCAICNRTSERRLNQDTIIDNFIAYGFIVENPDDYINNRTIVAVICIECKISDDISLSKAYRGCKTCRKQESDRLRIKNEMFKIRQIAKSKGGKCLSLNGDYKDQTSKLKFIDADKSPFTLRANKLKRGQWNPATRYIRSGKTNKENSVDNR